MGISVLLLSQRRAGGRKRAQGLFLGLYNFCIFSIGYIFSSVCMHTLAYAHAVRLHAGLFSLCALGLF